MPRKDRYRSRLYPRDVTQITGARTFNIDPKAITPLWNYIPPQNFSAHSLSHSPKHRTYTFPLSMGAVTGTAYWTPQFDGQMLSVRIGLKSNDPASNASGTVFDLLLNDTSVFANAAEKPTITSGTTHSPIVIITRGVWVSGDSWTMQCISKGGATGTVTASFEYLGGGD
jgi:hypothetical protein